MREKSIEEKLVAAVKVQGGVCWKFTSPGTAGVPDRIVSVGTIDEDIMKVLENKDKTQAAMMSAVKARVK